jgi:hypothetical protein
MSETSGGGAAVPREEVAFTLVLENFEPGVNQAIYSVVPPPAQAPGIPRQVTFTFGAEGDPVAPPRRLRVTITDG